MIHTKVVRVGNPKYCLKYTCSLVWDVIGFMCDLKLLKAINRNYYDVIDTLITILLSINSALTFPSMLL